jgi:hypothetical protein
MNRATDAAIPAAKSAKLAKTNAKSKPLAPALGAYFLNATDCSGKGLKPIFTFCAYGAHSTSLRAGFEVMP